MPLFNILNFCIISFTSIVQYTILTDGRLLCSPLASTTITCYKAKKIKQQTNKQINYKPSDLQTSNESLNLAKTLASIFIMHDSSTYKM